MNVDISAWMPVYPVVLTLPISKNIPPFNNWFCAIYQEPPICPTVLLKPSSTVADPKPSTAPYPTTTLSL